ncbi:hypothetical protein COBT_003760 [Conglomerata obtusa]
MDDEKKTKRSKDILEGKMNKHVLKEYDKEYWISDNGLKREMPNIEKRKNLVFDMHEDLNHRGLEATYYSL